MPYPAQWKWGQGRPTGTVTEVADQGSLSIQSSNGNTITRKADANNPAVHLKQDSGTDVVKRASELEIVSDEPDQDDENKNEKSNTEDGKLRKPFPAPRQSAPISRPADTEQEKEEANLSIEEQAKLAEERDKKTEGSGGGQTTIHGHTNGEPATESADTMMDLREEVQAREPSPEKQSTVDASVGEKRGRSEEPAATSNEQPVTSGSAEKKESKEDQQEAEAPEPETKKPRVEEPTAKVTDPTAPESTELDAKPTETAESSSEPPKKKAGRPKKEETRAAPGERKNSISSRTRSKANAEEVSI
ncbi:hypothetical protein TWF730_009882 [Orbilia blumenaviensis]|uniref:Hypervirulence associated protein TUDOR domain-containing protein n=1 Tax=Orbilia blumenaviensis TaxID=1796055 RepID=A0AAV9UT17_9PEZI